jgi:hypothetical protein
MLERVIERKSTDRIDRVNPKLKCHPIAQSRDVTYLFGGDLPILKPRAANAAIRASASAEDSPGACVAGHPRDDSAGAMS